MVVVAALIAVVVAVVVVLVVVLTVGLEVEIVPKVCIGRLVSVRLTAASQGEHVMSEQAAG